MWPAWFVGLQPLESRIGDHRFLEESIREGVLFKRGAYNYASLAHDEEDTLVEIERCASSALVAITNAPAGDE